MGTEFARRVSVVGLAAVVAGAAAFVSSPPPSVVGFFGVLSVGVGFGALTAALYAYLGVKMPSARWAPAAGVTGDPFPEAPGEGPGADSSGGTRSAGGDGTGEGGFLYAAERSVSGDEERPPAAGDGDLVDPEPAVVEAEDAGSAVVEAEDAGSAVAEAAGAEPAVAEEVDSADVERPAGARPDGTAESETGQFTFFTATDPGTSGDEAPDVERPDDETPDDETTAGWTLGEAERSDDADDSDAERTPPEDADADGDNTFVLGGDEFVVEASPDR